MESFTAGASLLRSSCALLKPALSKDAQIALCFSPQRVLSPIGFHSQPWHRCPSRFHCLLYMPQTVGGTFGAIRIGAQELAVTVKPPDRPIWLDVRVVPAYVAGASIIILSLQALRRSWPDLHNPARTCLSSPSPGENASTVGRGRAGKAQKFLRAFMDRRGGSVILAYQLTRLFATLTLCALTVYSAVVAQDHSGRFDWPATLLAVAPVRVKKALLYLSIERSICVSLHAGICCNTVRDHGSFGPSNFTSSRNASDMCSPHYLRCVRVPGRMAVRLQLLDTPDERTVYNNAHD